MPTAEKHRKKAERNSAFLGTITIEDYPDWVAVAAFYAAVHLVEALRDAAGHGDSKSHEDRLAYTQHHLPPAVHTDYHVLQNVSMLARYQSIGEFFAQFQPDDVRDEIVAKRLAGVQAHAEAMLGPAKGRGS